MLLRFIVIAGLGLCLAAGIVRADEAATDELIERLEGIEQLAGRFDQEQFSRDSGEKVGGASGSFKLLRPHYFAWEIDAPDSQLIVADPEYVWHHDRDLETVTRRPVEGNEALSPLQVLGGDNEALRANYQVERDGEGRYQLTPNASNAGFKQLVLVLEDGQLAGMEIRDNLDQRLVISFSAVETSPGLTPADFAFQPPEGVDLFYHDQ